MRTAGMQARSTGQPARADGLSPSGYPPLAALSPFQHQAPAERCRNCGCEHTRRRFKRRDLCGKCFYLFECIKVVERWDRAKPRTLKNIGALRRQFGGDAALGLDKVSEEDFSVIKSNYLEQLGAALLGLRAREARRRGDARVDGLAIEGKLKDILKVVQLRDRYDRVAGRFSGVATILDRAFSPEQCRILYGLLDDIEEQTYGRVTEGHKALEAVYQNRAPDPAISEGQGAVTGATPSPEIAIPAEAPHDLWLIDFKHRFQSTKGWLYPLLVIDAHASRVVFQAVCMSNDFEALKDRLTEAFRLRGAPKRLAVRHSQPRSTFSPLDVWLIEHDITVDQIAQQQSQTLAPFDRLLRRLRAEVLDTSFSNHAAAEEALADWSARVNAAADCSGSDPAAPAGEERMVARPFAEQIVPFEYESHDIVRRVQERGRISLFGRIIRVAKSFRGKDVAFRSTLEDGVFDVLFRIQKITTIKVRSTAWRGSFADPYAVGRRVPLASSPSVSPQPTGCTHYPDELAHQRAPYQPAASPYT